MKGPADGSLPALSFEEALSDQNVEFINKGRYRGEEMPIVVSAVITVKTAHVLAEGVGHNSVGFLP